MGSSKTISSQQIFWLIVLFQQSGIFWLLPYYLVGENGTIGLIAIAIGMLWAVAILCIGQYWYMRMPDLGFATALKQRQRLAGTITGGLFLLFYLLFAVMMLYSFVDVTHQQLLEETPGIVLCAVTVLLAGWMSRGGLESIARLNVLCVGAVVLMLAVSVAGTADLFAVENALPLQIKNPLQLQHAALHSIFCYSGMMVLFMIYPAAGKDTLRRKTLVRAVALGGTLTVLWTFYALCILGEYSLQSILWIPVHLARMVQISTFLEQTESLFVILWMMLSVIAGSLLLWCASEVLHQLLQKQQTWWVHWTVVLAVLLGTIAVRNSMRLLLLEAVLARAAVLIVPVMLLMIVLLTPRRRKQP